MNPEPGGQTGDDYILELRDVKKWFPVDTGFFSGILSRAEKTYVKAVDGLSFNVKRGEVFGLAGESGSGKTTVGRLAIRLLELTEGQVCFDGVDLATLSSEELRHHRSRMQVIFQDPMASLNPRMTIGDAIAHPLLIHNPEEKERKKDHVYEVLDSVGLAPPATFYNKYPHQISGGQRQRVVVARALITKPELILADEPIAMADVSVRALLLDLMIQLKEVFNLTYLFITHDLATAKYICDRIGIMYLGKLVEVGPLVDVYSNPVHPYTRALLAAVPVPDPNFRRTEPLPRGEIPSPINPPSGCRFHPRCPIARDICHEESPSMLPVAGHAEHKAACHLRTGNYQHLDPNSG
ncbi:MAG: ABC transporter ATP-binding protein [Candidatus Promineifilaceae bacterium]